jgi:hypothetical protein
VVWALQVSMLRVNKKFAGESGNKNVRDFMFTFVKCCGFVPHNP